jgi:integrase
MGPSLRKPPRFTRGFVDRHGRPRWYFRRAGFKSVALPGLPWSPEFMAAYEFALAGEDRRADIGSKRTVPGTISAAIISYFNSAAFQSLATETRRTRRSALERFRAEHGDKRIALLGQHHIRRLLEAKSATPFMARNFLKALRGLMQHCVEHGLRAEDPTRGVKYTRIQKERQGGFTTWSEEQIAQFEAKHTISSRARLAFGLLLFTGQRRSDVLRMGRQHIANGCIKVRQQKTGVELDLPIHDKLQEILNASAVDNLTFLVTEFGKPFSAAGFSNLFRRWVKEAGLPAGISAHGLRKACCRRLAEAGCSASLIKSISGHVSLREVERYVAAADQVRMARAAIKMVGGVKAKTRTSSGKPE